METNRRFSLLTFPQYFDGNTLTLNILVLPRNQNPLQGAIIKHDGVQFPPPVIPDAPAFADAKLTFEAKVITGLGTFPNNQLPSASPGLGTNPPANARDLFTALGKNFSIKNLAQTNEDLDSNDDSAKKSPAVSAQLSIKKYLPVSYRSAFNFTNPRTPNAVTDDSYHCAVRDAGKVPGFKRSPNEISWGKVFAFILRQPLLAEQAGMLYHASLAVGAGDFPLGGWLYVDLAADSDYKAQQQADDTFIKKYAARIPPLEVGQARQVFTPILFPVLFKANPGDPDPAPDGNFDQLFIETAEYDDGFAKIVHAAQPVSQNLLVENSDGAHPVKDVGLRLGWDDEQILIWYMRQTAIDPTVTGPDRRLDAPLGVFGYAVDVRDTANPANPWESLNGVTAKTDLVISNPPGQPVPVAQQGAALELPYQVYPAQLDGDQAKNYWLPMYFASWNGHSVVLPDPDAVAVYQTSDPNVKADPETLIPVAKQDPADPEYPNKMTGTGSGGPAQNGLNKIYSPDPLQTALRYGEQYQFRIRLQDLSGGGPVLSPDVNPINDSPSDLALVRFRRYVAPQQPRVDGLTINSDTPPKIDLLKVQRPLLTYPAVVYTGKYADPIPRLVSASQAMIGKEAFGIADPDVDRIQVTVEVETLRMDNLLSTTGTENYVQLYTTTRAFPQVNNDDDYEDTLDLPLIYRDCPVLHVGAELDLKDDLGLADDIDKLAEIYLPTARTIRLTLRAVAEEKPSDADYYGLINPADQNLDSRFGQIIQIRVYCPSQDETSLFVGAAAAQKLQGFYLQPDPPVVFNGQILTLLLGQQAPEALPDLVQRLAKQLKVESKGLTLTAQAGERIVFGCSSRIRHTLSPEGGSLTFATKDDLLNHWLCVISLDLNRDWTWDALADRSFAVTRTSRFTHDNPATETDTDEVGTLEVRHTATLESLRDVQRDYTRLIFIDAVEPKNARTQPAPNQTRPRFPDTIEVQYSVAASFKPGHALQQDPDQELEVSLPITTPPAQIPQIASAGIALSPYERNTRYSATQPRQRHLWVEFTQPVLDPNDAVFARVLANMPDQLISNNEPDLFVAPQEPALPIDPEVIRVIPPGATNDLAGLNAMQLIEKASDSDRHYLVPLPPGLSADSPEMFGFFHYEFRLGHYRNKDSEEMAWCTAQGRFGRPLRATGVQHPAPALTCSVGHDTQILYVSAPYASAVFNGKEVTADPPRTELWALLYAQVKQADNLDFRNILLDEKPLDWRVQVETNPAVNWLEQYDENQRTLLKAITIKTWKDELSYGKYAHVFKLVDTSSMSKDAIKYGTTVWSNDEVGQLLQIFGLPEDSALSVLVVEILPTITNIFEAVSGLGDAAKNAELRQNLQIRSAPTAGDALQQQKQMSRVSDYLPQSDPLGSELGNHRILRTSPLTEVPPAC